MRFLRTVIVHPVLAVGVTALAAFGAQRSDAATVTNAVYLAIDSSGSISSSDFTLQRDAYEFLLGATPTDGSRAIGFLQFSTNVQEIFPLTQINSEDDVDDLTSAIAGLSQIGNLTDLAGAIETASSSLTGSADFDCTSDDVQCAVDVSTDGVQTVAGDPDSAADDAVAAGADQVNCLGVGIGYDCSFIAGDGSFMLSAESFDDFEDALGQKLLLEGAIDEIPIRPEVVVPLPASGVLLLASLGGLGLAFGRRKAG